MDDQGRIAFIRRGNELFNNGDYKNSLKIFLATDYKDGIIRVADYLYFDKKDNVSAVKLYKRAGHQKVIDEFAEKAAEMIHMMLEEDRKTAEEEKLAREFEQKVMNMQKWEPVVLSADEIKNMHEIKPGGNGQDEKRAGNGAKNNHPDKEVGHDKNGSKTDSGSGKDKN